MVIADVVEMAKTDMFSKSGYHVEHYLRLNVCCRLMTCKEVAHAKR